VWHLFTLLKQQNRCRQIVDGTKQFGYLSIGAEKTHGFLTLFHRLTDLIAGANHAADFQDRLLKERSVVGMTFFTLPQLRLVEGAVQNGSKGFVTNRYTDNRVYCGHFCLLWSKVSMQSIGARPVEIFTRSDDNKIAFMVAGHPFKIYAVPVDVDFQLTQDDSRVLAGWHNSQNLTGFLPHCTPYLIQPLNTISDIEFHKKLPVVG
jgi:hypothetical protein